QPGKSIKSEGEVDPKLRHPRLLEPNHPTVGDERIKSSGSKDHTGSDTSCNGRRKKPGIRSQRKGHDGTSQERQNGQQKKKSLFRRYPNGGFPDASQITQKGVCKPLWWERLHGSSIKRARNIASLVPGSKSHAGLDT